MAFNEDSSASGHDEPWIQWFCGLKGHEMFCEVERSYIEDGFNLYGLRACVSNFSDCLDLILDRIGPDDSDDSHLTQSACTLYGLIHARYIITAHGLDAMYNKYAAKDFGTCPLVQCQLQNVLPVGLKDEMGADTVKLFCPKCQNVYHAPPVRSRANNNGGVDGAAFGTTFPHLFLMTFSNLVPDPLPVETSYIPRVFGFRVHKSARQHHRASSAGSNTNNNAQPPSIVAAMTSTEPAGGANNSNNVAVNDKATIDNNTQNSNNNNQINGDQTATGAPAEQQQQQQQPAGDTNMADDDDESNPTAASGGPVADEDPNKQRVAKSSKRPARTQEDGGSSNGNKQTQQQAPTFLMENSAKRRRRTTNSNTT